MLRKVLLLVLVAVSLSSFTAVFAQDEMTEIASGLNSPRHLFYGADGSLYIAEAGKGGEIEGEGPFGPATYGETSQFSVVSPEGEQSVLIPGLISLDAGFGQIEGAMAIYVTESSYWAVLGLGLKEAPEGKNVEALVEYDRETLEVKQVVDLRAFETENNPDESDEIVANPADIAVDADGKVYIADASANSLLTWTPDDGVQLFAAWPVVEGELSAVPTSVSIGPDGDVYVGFLSGFPFPAGGARIERYAADGTLKQTYEGLTLVTDVLVTEDGTIYAVQFADGFGDQGYNAGTGSVVTVSEDGLETVAGELNFPYGIALSPDGTLAVSVESFGVAPDSGKVIAVGGM
ncbi:MAG: ScyD/ScyE family protein [Anaerolineae bacterium]|nr:ScyD/ScyE family protein [Anaerolineae bacterium]